MVEVGRMNDWMMSIKLVVGGLILNVISAYSPQTGLDEEVKKHFCEDLDEVIWGIPPNEKIFLEGDSIAQTGTTSRVDDVHGNFGSGDRNWGVARLDFARAFDLVIVNSRFQKEEEHLVTSRCTVAKTQIDYLLFKKSDRGLCKDCKVISSENLAIQHKLLVVDVEI